MPVAAKGIASMRTVTCNSGTCRRTFVVNRNLAGWVTCPVCQAQQREKAGQPNAATHASAPRS